MPGETSKQQLLALLLLILLLPLQLLLILHQLLQSIHPPTHSRWPVYLCHPWDV